LGASRESLAADFVDAVAALHRFDWRSTPFGEFDQRHAAEAVFVDGEDAQGFTILPGERKKEIRPGAAPALFGGRARDRRPTIAR
jgi:hypothetical protein